LAPPIRRTGPPIIPGRTERPAQDKTEPPIVASHHAQGVGSSEGAPFFALPSMMGGPVLPLSEWELENILSYGSNRRYVFFSTYDAECFTTNRRTGKKTITDKNTLPFWKKYYPNSQFFENIETWGDLVAGLSKTSRGSILILDLQGHGSVPGRGGISSGRAGYGPGLGPDNLSDQQAAAITAAMAPNGVVIVHGCNEAFNSHDQLQRLANLLKRPVIANSGQLRAPYRPEYGEEWYVFYPQ